MLLLCRRFDFCSLHFSEDLPIIIVHGVVILLYFQALVARLSEGTGVNANNNIVIGVLVTVGDLARVVSLWFLD